MQKHMKKENSRRLPRRDTKSSGVKAPTVKGTLRAFRVIINHPAIAAITGYTPRIPVTRSAVMKVARRKFA
jgi:hypothetical protein